MRYAWGVIIAVLAGLLVYVKRQPVPVEHGPSETFGTCRCGGTWGVVFENANGGNPQSQCLRLYKLRMNGEYGKVRAL